jgi:hypothetical protein
MNDLPDLDESGNVQAWTAIPEFSCAPVTWPIPATSERKA